MANGTRRLTAFLVALVLIVSLLPAAGVAADVDGSDGAAVVTEEEPADKTEGSPETTAASDGLTTSAYTPYANILYTYSSEAERGTIRYVSQKPKSKYFMGDKYWPPTSLTDEWKCKWQCKSADVSMMLSYLGIDLLPKDIINSKGNGDNNCMEKDWGEAKNETDLSFAEAMDNYLNGGGLYSPPMIRLTNDCFKKSGQHFVLVLSKKSATKYEVLDPYQNDIWEMTIDGNKITRFKWGSKYYTSTFTNIYQYHKEQKTKLKNASKPGTMTEGSIFAPKGQLYGSEIITKVTAACYDMEGNAQSCCNQTAKPNSVGYDLANMNNKLKFSQLEPGIYKYVVKAATASGTKTYLTKMFTVLAKEKKLDNATFYLDSGCNIKYCAMPEDKSSKNSVNICLTPNSESPYMRFKATYASNGYYTLSVVGSGKYLTVYKSKNESGTRVMQYEMVKRDGQYWQFLPAGNGNYYLVPKCAPTCCLTLTDGEVADGTRLQIRTAGQSQEQTWLLRPVRALLTGLKNTTSGVQVRWGTVPHATGYRVYRKKSGETGWTRVQTITSGKTASWIDPNVSNGTQYAYTVRSVYGQHLSPSCPQKSKYRLTAPRMLTPKNSGKGRITVSWKVNSKASGYQVCYAGNSSFRDSHTVTVSGRNTLSKVLTGLRKGRTYYLKVRTYKIVSGEKYYSAWSSAKSVKVIK